MTTSALVIFLLNTIVIPSNILNFLDNYKKNKTFWAGYHLGFAILFIIINISIANTGFMWRN